MMDHKRVAATLTALVCLLAGCGDDDDHAARTVTATAAATATRTATAVPPTPTLAAVPSSTASVAVPTATPTAAPASPTATETSAVSPTPTSTPPIPAITYFGIARADDLIVAPTATDPMGRAVFVRGQGQAMSLVLEARRGVRPLAVIAYDSSGGQRGVEFLVSRPLGDGSPEVCDVSAPNFGGVPGTDPPVFSSQPAVQQAIDDLGCRVNDGSGTPAGRSAANACTRMDPTFEYGFVADRSELQFCLPIARAWSFPVGDTIVAARVRDVTGTFSETREIVIRVEPEQPFECDQGIGERDFTPRRPASRLLSSTLPGAEGSADPWSAQPLRICSGRAFGDGSYPLSLREDAYLGIPLADGGLLCVHIASRASGGILDCNGGLSADVLAAQEIGDDTISVDVAGLDAGTGAALILAPMALATLAAGATAADCDDAPYGPSFSGALTTAMATTQLLDANQAVQAEVTSSGAPFDCATWSEAGGGTLALPLPIVGGAVTDRAAVLLLSD